VRRQLLYIAAELKICSYGPIITSDTPIERYALTKKIAYQDFRNIDLFGKKSGESVKVNI